MSNEGFEQDRVAIVGMGLSFPGGAEDPDSFWQLLQNKTDATVDIPEDRWDWRRFYSPFGSEKPGKMYVRRGGFLQGDIRAFDPLYFGISPREAAVIDVQQRLLLEVAAKALQDAGMPEERFQGSRMGVFVGGFCMDASIEAASIHNRNWYVTQSVTGSTATLLSNRLSYVFDLKGPSLTVDTACSSSLVALHIAVQSLLAGECEAALVGGVNAMTQPEHFLEMCKGRLLSKDGRCFTWDQRANGYARGEGAGMVLIKRLSQALRDGDHIHAVIEATGVNQDGTTQGISLPNPKAQAALIRAVLDKAGLAPVQIDYVEAHGTGTQAGDKAETSALNEVFAPGRQDKLRIGSVKTNIGHLEAAAGMSGLIKTVLSLSRGKIPANLHFETPNPAIPFDSMCLQPSGEMQDWPQRGGTRYAGVNSFGYGGTNAHAILSHEPLPAVEQDRGEISEAGQGPLLLPLSAQSQESLRSLAAQYQDLLQQEGLGLRSFLRQVSTRRTHYERRALVWADDKRELITRLQQFAAGTAAEGFSQVAQPSGPDRLVFVYSGMGPQWWGMGQELLASHPLFAETLREYDRVFQGIAGWSLLEEMTRPEASSRMARTEVAQPANFAIQAGLTALWRYWGVEPAAVVGHSVGEVTAAYVSGILSLEDALRVSYHRSRLQGTLAHTGGMLAVGLSEEAVQPYLREHDGRVSVAAVNSPRAVTLAGHTASLQALAVTLQETGVFHRALQVEVPYHSPLMDPIEQEIQDCLRQIQPRPATIPCYSTVTARQAAPGDFGARYWWHNVRETVSFARTVQALCEDGYRSFLEVGPHPVLGNSIKEILVDRKLSGQVYSSLRRQMPEQATLLASLGTLYSQGYRLDWDALQPPVEPGARRVVLPVYPWHKQHYDHGSPRFHQDKFGSRGHPILGSDLELPRPAWEVTLNDAQFPYLVDHRIDDKTVVPGAFYVEAALALLEKHSGARVGSLQGLAFERFLALADEMEGEEARIVSSYSEDTQDFRIHSTRTALKESWECHARGTFAPLAPLDRELDMLDQDLNRFQSHDIEAFYRRIASTGLQYGPSFRPIRCLKSLGDKVYAELDNTLAHEPAYILPPTVLDSVFQTLLLFGGGQGVPFVPVRIDRLSVHGVVTTRNKVLGRLNWRSARSLKADFMVFDEQDNPIVEIRGVTCQALPSFGPARSRIDETLYRSVWRPCEALAQGQPAAGGVLLLSDSPDGGARFAAHIGRRLPVQTLDLSRWSESAFEDRLRSQPIGTVVYHTQAAATEAQALEMSIAHCVRLGQVAQALDRVAGPGGSRLVLVTHEACSVQTGDRIGGLAQLALTGLARTLNTECRTLRCASIDLSDADTADAATLETQMQQAVDALIAQDPGVQELALRGGQLYRHVLLSYASEAAATQDAVEDSAPGEGVQLEDLAAAATAAVPFSEQPRVLMAPCPQRPTLRVLGEDEVEIEVEHRLLNAFDLHNSQLSVLPDDPARHYFRYQPGMQCVGRVVKKGAAVSQLALGDRVLSLQANGLGSHAAVPAQGLLRMPEALDPLALPDLYECVRALHVMKTLGTPARGAQLVVKGRWGSFVETLLHEAGQRGYALSFVDEESSPLACEGLARHAGARYLAAEPGLWQAQLDGLIAGVDVFVNHGWQDIGPLPRLQPFARVLDCRSAQVARKAGPPALRANASYQTIEVDELFRDHFPTMEASLRELLQALAQGRLPLARLPNHPWRDIAAALRELKTPGQGAVWLRDVQASVPVARRPLVQDKSWDGSYVVTGGTRGFGLQCARWLVEQGARHLVLISRSGAGSAEAQQALQSMRQQGATVRVCALDIAEATELRAALGATLADMPPVRGVLHAAMVLDDGFVSQMSEARYRLVMRPKMQGALNLAAALDPAGLRFFLMFSSISSLIGNAGQANYVAANSFLDGYASHLSARGVPAKTINWGVLSDSGVLAQDAELSRMLALAGIQGVGNELAMQALDRVLGEAPAQVGVFRMDWALWKGANPSQSASGLYGEVLVPAAQSDEDDPLQQLLLAVIDASPEERRRYVQAQLSERFGQIFKMDASQINVHASIIELGVDSLIAAEITMALRTELGVEIALIDMLSGPSIASLAERILVQIEALIEETRADDSADDSPSLPAPAPTEATGQGASPVQPASSIA